MTTARNRALKNPLIRKACRWCEGKFTPKKSDTETTCSTACSEESRITREWAPEAREAKRQQAVATRRAKDAERAGRLRGAVSRIEDTRLGSSRRE